MHVDRLVPGFTLLVALPEAVVDVHECITESCSPGWVHVGAAIAGQNVDTTLTVAVIDDLNNDGVFNDAPNVVTDLNQDGRIDAQDLKLLGVASNIVTVPFGINGAPAQP